MGSEDLIARSSADEIDALEVRWRQMAGAILIDVREFEDWEAGHAPGARCIPFVRLDERLGALRGPGGIVFICNSGGRSGLAAAA